MNQLVADVNTMQANAKPTLGLVYIPALDVGITRKKRASRFLYFHPDGSRIKDAAEIVRLEALAIPPAYTDVVISTNPFSHLQAIGTMPRGADNTDITENGTCNKAW